MVLMEETQVPAGDVQFAPEIQASNVIWMIVVLALMIVGAYYLTKYVNGRALTKGMKKKPAGKNKRRLFQNDTGRLLCVADRIVIDREKTVMVVEFKGKYYLLSTTQQEIRCIDSIPIPQEDLDAEAKAAQEEAEEAGEDSGAGEAITFAGFLGGIGTQFKDRAYAFFHKGQAPPKKSSFESHLKQKIEEEEKSFQNITDKNENRDDGDGKNV